VREYVNSAGEQVQRERHAAAAVAADAKAIADAELAAAWAGVEEEKTLLRDERKALGDTAAEQRRRETAALTAARAEAQATLQRGVAEYREEAAAAAAARETQLSRRFEQQHAATVDALQSDLHSERTRARVDGDVSARESEMLWKRVAVAEGRSADAEATARSVKAAAAAAAAAAAVVPRQLTLDQQLRRSELQRAAAPPSSSSTSASSASSPLKLSSLTMSSTSNSPSPPAMATSFPAKVMTTTVPPRSRRSLFDESTLLASASTATAASLSATATPLVAAHDSSYFSSSFPAPMGTAVPASSAGNPHLFCYAQSLSSSKRRWE
jgi:hypothetical protein